uniref:Uncharacterized protein n=1 Tax=Setaria digitata TaxID=48799 RepID=A0A915Q766_9BILA
MLVYSASVLLVEMSMKLGAQHSRIGLTKMSMRKANRQQQRIVLKIIYFTCNKDMREQLLSLWIHLWQNFLGYNRALLTGRYQLALTSAGQEQSVRHLPTVESRSKKRQHHSATTTADITLTLSTSITGDVDALLNLKEQEEEQQRRRKKVRCNSSIN